MRDLVTWCESSGIPAVTVFALSRDNLYRANEAIGQILCAVAMGLESIAETGKWHIRIIGELDLVPAAAAAQLASIADRTTGESWGTLNVGVAYDGRTDIVNAVRSLMQEDSAGDLVTENDLERYLSTAGQPDIDLVIRTSGECRLSGFMPWQAAYAEYYVTQTAWPEFTVEAFTDALNWFLARERRFGH